MLEVYFPVSPSVQTGEFMEGHILILSVPRDWQGFKYFTSSSSLSGGTGKKKLQDL